MAATKPGLASGGITHCRLRCGLGAFFERPPDRIVAGLVDDVQFDDFLFEETQAPTSESFRSWRASQSDQFRLRRPVENPRPRGVGAILALQRRLEPLLDQLLTGASDIVDAGVQRSRDRAVAPPFASVRYVSLQQNARSRQYLR